MNSNAIRMCAGALIVLLFVVLWEPWLEQPVNNNLPTIDRPTTQSRLPLSGKHSTAVQASLLVAGMPDVRGFKHPNEWIQWAGELGLRLYSLEDPSAALAALKTAGESMRHTDRQRLWHGFLKSLSTAETIEGHYAKLHAVLPLLEQMLIDETVGYPARPALNAMLESVAFASLTVGMDNLEKKLAASGALSAYDKIWQKSMIALRLSQEPALGVSMLSSISDMETSQYAEDSVLRNLAVTDDTSAISYFLSEASVAVPTKSLVDDIAGPAAREGFSTLLGFLQTANPSQRKDAVILCLLENSPGLTAGEFDQLLHMASDTTVRESYAKAFGQRYAEHDSK